MLGKRWLLRVILVISLQVYLPCVLQTKKRYVGYMYETLDQKDPIFDAKGIETVRRDSCPAVSKVSSMYLIFICKK
jgi:DNA polymerase zeta